MLEKFEQVNLYNCSISEITLAELVYGAENSLFPEKNHNLIQPFSKQVVILPIFDSINFYGKEKARLRKAGILISDFELLIDCTAVENNLILITENVKDFQRISNIKIKNWINR